MRANSERWRWVLRWSRHGRLREHGLWAGPGSREGGWCGRCKSGGKIRGPTEHTQYGTLLCIKEKHKLKLV
uniref:Uncharacterized protein n=1 Tax=Timema cristinae TaxID=61476 RepID=A0A7R9H286_TIMCR|nr:unnamed protein product [Timema cristinae]